MKLSVIVPMYNVEKYLKQCLDSLLYQTFTDFEVIIVNDGSTDNSAQIASEYVFQYPNRFYLLHKENGGLSDARNYGILYARGEYITFLDSDDFIEANLYEKMIGCIKEGHDVVVCDIEYWYENKDKRFVMKGMSDWSVSDRKKRALLSPMFAWNKVYHKKFFKEAKLRYPLDTWYEDIPVTSMIFATAHSIGYINETLIHYRQREGSIMAECKNKRLFEIFDIMKMLRDNFQRAKLFDIYQTELEYLHIEHLCLYGMFRMIRSNFEIEGLKQVNEIMKQEFPNWHQNPYLVNLSFKNRMFLKFYCSTTAKLFRKFIR